jgi:DNA-binding transcriptional ArsR family regulator
MSTKIDTAEALDSRKLEKIAFILKTVAHPVRLGIIQLLDENDRLSAGEINDRLGTEQSLTSHHLQNLRYKGILSAARRGRQMFYALKERDVTKLIKCLEDCDCNM